MGGAGVCVREAKKCGGTSISTMGFDDTQFILQMMLLLEVLVWTWTWLSDDDQLTLGSHLSRGEPAGYYGGY